MFSRKKDKRASLASPPPPPPQHQHQHDRSRSSLASSTGSSGAHPSYRPSATSPDLAADASAGARGRRSSFFGFGGNGSKGGEGGPAAPSGANGGGGLGGLLGRTTSRFSTHDGEGGAPPPTAAPNGRRESSFGSAGAGGGGGARGGQPAGGSREEYASSFSSSLPPTPHPPTPPPPSVPGKPPALAAQRSAAAQEGLRHAVNLLTAVQPEKVYHSSPPTVRSLHMYGVDGKHPKAGPPGSAGNDWRETWLELRGVVLHSWDMKEVQEHNARGEDKHPTRTNITDAYVDIVPALPPTDHARSQGDTAPHPFVFSVNSAGLNAVLFSCETEAVRDEWVCAIRLAGWEHARLQEVYTGHLIRASLTAPLPAQLTAAQPTIAGWFDVRTFGSRSWTHLWVVLSVASPAQEADDRRRAIAAAAQAQADATAAAASSAKSRKRLSNMFSSGAGKDLAHTTTPYLPPVPGDGSPTTAGGLAGQQQQQTDGGRLLSNVPVVKASFYLAPPLGSPGAGANSSSAGRRTSISQQAAAAAAPPAKPVLVLSDLHQAYAVFPETPAAVDASGMFKLEGALAGEAVGASGRKRDEGWCLLIPGDKRGDEWVGGGKLDMIRWLTAFHDAFKLYGRPRHYSWDPRDPSSLFFGHPGGPSEPDLFLATAPAASGEVATARPSFVRGRLRERLADKMGVPVGARLAGSSSPALGQDARNAPLKQQQQQQQQRLPPSQNGTGDYQSRNSQSTDGGRSSTPGSQAGRGVAPPGGGFQLPPLSFDEEQQPATTQQQRRPSTQQHQPPPPPQQQQRAPIDPSLQPVDVSSVEGTPKQPAAQFAAPPTPKATAPAPAVREDSLSSLPTVTTPSTTGGTAAVSHLLVQRAAAGPPPAGTVLPESPEYAYEVTPDAQTPATEYSQSSAAPGDQSTGGAPSLHTSEPRQRAPQRDESEDGFEDYVPAHMIETGLPDEPAPVQPIVRQQPAQPPPVLSPTSPSAYTAAGGRMASLGRRPSGARAAPPRRVASGSTASMPPFSDEDERAPAAGTNGGTGARTPEQRSFGLPQASSPGRDTHTADALAALTFLETTASPDKPTTRELPPPPPSSSAVSTADEKRLSLPKLTTAFDGSGAPAPVPAEQQFPSSFGPGKNAAERKAKLEAAERQRQEAMHKPGRGKALQAAKKPSQTGGWQSSDEDDDDDDADESPDEDARPAGRPAQQQQQPTAIRPLPQNPGSLQPDPSQAQPAPSPSQYDFQQQRPEYGANGQSFGASGSQARPASNYTFNNGGHTLPHSTSRSTLHQVVQPEPRPGALPHSRSSMWNTHLEAPHGGLAAEQADGDKFVTIEPSATLTKAFNPNGLLQAGLADRDERSAKRQEELARAEGSSLVNVPPPPPPPQMGLLGAITGYEAQRSREGGVGAALTERDRERREADERARKADNLQRSQMEQMSQQGYAYPYGQPPQPGLMPGMMPWGMGWGMQPQMSQYGGYGGQMDPQAQMIAQQAAQMAYQQAMMTYSQAGSQMGGSPSMMMPPPSTMGWPGAGPPGGAGGGMPYWGGAMGSPAAMPSPMPFLPPAQSYPSSRAGSVFNGNGHNNGGGSSEYAGARRPSPAPSRGRSPHHASRSPSNVDLRHPGQQQQQQQSQSSTPRSKSNANLHGQ